MSVFALYAEYSGRSFFVEEAMEGMLLKWPVGHLYNPSKLNSLAYIDLVDKVFSYRIALREATLSRISSV